MLRFILLLSILLFAAPHSMAQSLYFTPLYTQSDRIRFLTAPRFPRTLEAEISGFVRGDTNVLTFGQAGQRPAPALRFTDSSGYEASQQYQRIALAQGNWVVSYDHGLAELYRSNREGAQLYLDSLAKKIDPQAIYTPFVSLNRTGADRWHAAWTAALPVLRRGAVLRVGLSYLRLNRGQLGVLQGSTISGQFHGTIALMTTLDVPPDEQDGQAAGLDAALRFPLSPRCAVSLTAENILSRVWQRHVQNIAADVTTNTLQPDSNGFLQGAPLLSGRVTQQSLQTAMRPRLDFGLTYRERTRDWLLLLANDFDWRVSAGVRFALHRKGHLWLLVTPAPLEWQAGVDSGPIRFQISLSGFGLDVSQRASVLLALRFPR